MPSSKTKRRKARAVKRFLIQILVLAVLVAACAYVILNTGGRDPVTQPSAGPAAEPKVTKTPKPKPTPKPTPVPSPYPEDQVSALAEVKVPEAKLDSPIMAMVEYAQPSPGDQNAVLVVSGWAFLTGKDAAKTNTYVVLTSASDGAITAYRVRVLEDGQDVADLYPDQGKHLDQARFECAVNVSQLPDGFYSVSLLLENGKTREHKALEPPIDLDIWGGAVQ